MIPLYKNFSAFVVLPIIFVSAGIYFLGSSVADFENFVRDYAGTIISLGTLALVSFLALLTSHVSSKAADQREILAAEAIKDRETVNQRVQAELQIAKFRQAWIDETRSELAEFLQLAFHCERDDHVARMFYLNSKIKMRLNHKEKLALELDEAMRALAPGAIVGDAAQVKALTHATKVGNEFLRNEWGRLKEDIRKALLLEEGKT